MPHSWKKIIADSYQAQLGKQLPVLADTFYRVLWAKYPKSKTLFKSSDMQLQKEGLAKGIEFIVKNLNDEEALDQFIDDLGIRHGAYGVLPEHYAWVGDALLTALAECYTKKYWTPELMKAWQTLFSKIAAVMQQGISRVRMTGS